MYGFILLFISPFLLLPRVSTHASPPGNTHTKDTEKTKTTPNYEPPQIYISAHDCQPTFNLFCYFQAEGEQSKCECNKKVPAQEECPAIEGVNKYCNEDSSKCSCFYETGSGCRADWVFRCKVTEMPYADWECSCEGYPGDHKCPAGYNSCCEGNWCFKFTYFKSMFAETVEPIRVVGTAGHNRGLFDNRRPPTPNLDPIAESSW